MPDPTLNTRHIILCDLPSQPARVVLSIKSTDSTCVPILDFGELDAEGNLRPWTLAVAGYL